MKEISRHKWYRTMGAIAFAALFTAACAGPEKKEVGPQLAVARTAVADAVSAGAPEFAPMELRDAQENLDAAGKAAMAKDYKKAKWLGEKAQMNAQLAIARARSGKAKQAEEAVKESHRALQDEMNRTAE
ncbi:MAG: DUF4398 domain-containing protein [Nitrosospira sp.]|nr:DUF4398 domain-containing protein [Nitrosospira sp.]